MKVAVKNISNTETGQVTLPKQFNQDYRPDLIVRAVLSLQSRARQAYGADPEAGKRASAELSRRRRKYRGSYGFGISRVPRKILSRRGTRMYWVGAFAPGTVGGRRAHPPTAEKKWEQKINKKENRKAICSALSATMDKEMVSARGHKVPKDFPFIISDEFEALKKTAEVKKALLALGLEAELKRAEEKKIRAGKGTMRGRPYKKKKGPLMVVSKDSTLIKAAANIPGVEVVVADKLNAELLAPGTHSGRLTLYTESAIARFDKEKLFTNQVKVGEKE